MDFLCLHVRDHGEHVVFDEGVVLFREDIGLVCRLIRLSLRRKATCRKQGQKQQQRQQQA